MGAGTAARELAQDLRLARGRAIALERPVGVTFDAAAHGWRLDGGPARALPPALNMALLTVASLSPVPEAGRIVFAPDGSSSGGKIELGSAHLRMRVTVDWLTGRVGVTGAD